MNQEKTKILVCEDSQDLQLLFKKLLSQEGFDVKIVGTGRECIESIYDGYRILLLDINLPDISGIDVLKEIKPKHPKLNIIVVTAHSTIENAVEAIKLGAQNYLAKPFDNRKLLAAVKELISTMEIPTSALIIGDETRSMHAIKRNVEDISAKDAAILFHGESGTGKELFAHYAHHSSSRKNGPFIAVNCPAIPISLFEAELFGHEKGAFTGALQKKIGKIEQANQGTLFLDEVADLSSDSQAKLLRVLQEKVIEPLGAGKAKKIDFRVLSASSKDLRHEVAQGKFRLDLFYRLAEVEIDIPPLRERSEDIDSLVSYFCSEYAQEHACKPRQLNQKVLDKFRKYSWPGNIRELRSAVRRMLILDQSEGVIDTIPEGLLLPLSVTKTLEAKSGKPTADTLSMEENEKILIEEALKEANYNVSMAAKKLRIGRTTLYRKIKKFSIEVQ